MTIEHALLGFTAAAGLLTITPGLDTALVLRTAAVEGRRRAMLAGAGICLGLLTWGLTVSVGLGALLAVSRLAYTALRVAGACYLIFLGAKMFSRSRPSRFGPGESMPPIGENFRDSATRWFGRGLLSNLLNPKVGLFYVTFLPQFVPAGVNVAAFSMLLAAIHAAEGILWFLVLTHATGLFSNWFRRPQVAKALDQTTGTVLVGFGVGLMLDRSR